MQASWRRWGAGKGWRARPRGCPRWSGDRRGYWGLAESGKPRLAGKLGMRGPAQDPRSALMELRGVPMGVAKLIAEPRVRLLAVLSIGILAGCVTQSVTQTQEPLPAGHHRAVRIEPCEDRTGFQGERDLKGEATRVFIEKVQAAKLFEVTADAPLVLTCDIERFAEGSALKRWVLPGWGATQAGVSVMVWQKPDEKVLATFRSQSSVGAGGLYTIGADQYIFGVAFEDIVKQLGEWARGSAPEGKP